MARLICAGAFGVAMGLVLGGAASACVTFGEPGVDAIRARRGFSWQSIGTGHFQFYVEPGSVGARQIDTLQRREEESRQRVMTLLGVEDDTDRTSIFVVESRDRMKALLGYETNGKAVPDQRMVLYVFSDTVDASGPHELAHVYARTAWGPTEDWMNEGFAVFAADRWLGQSLHPVASYLLEQRRLIPLRELFGHFGRYPEDVRYPEAGSFVKFLYDSYGRDAVRRVWRGGASALAAVTGKSLEAVEREWHTRITRGRMSDPG